jgi:hypothetical protein
MASKEIPFRRISTIINPTGDQKMVSIRFELVIVCLGGIGVGVPFGTHLCSLSVLK